MRNVLLALVMSTASLFVAPAASADTANSDNAFVEVKGGSASIWDSGTSALGGEILGGYRWNTGVGKLGFELGYANFGDIESGTPSNGFAEFGASINHVHMIKAGADLNCTFGERFYIEPRIGLMRLSYTGVQRDVTPAGDFTSIHYDETKMGHYVGVGLGVWITSNFAVGLNFDRHTAEILGKTETISVTSAGVQFQF